MKLISSKIVLVTFFASILFTPAKSQFSVDTTYTVEELVSNFFNSGVLVDVSNITYNGEAADILTQQVVLFETESNTNFTMNEGLAMITGAALNSMTDTFISALYNNPPDVDMQTIADGATVNDCAVIEFDVLVSADALAFNFSFASQEYPAFTCSQFNDAFAFFVSGPGIQGPYSNDAINIATIPNSDIPISINTINSGESSAAWNEANCENANPNWQEDTQYFISNEDGEIPNFFPGYTQNIEAFIEVEQDALYHFKLAICDVVDGALDSGVFLEAGSFEGRLLSSVNNETSKEVRLFPNPVNDRIFLDLENIISGDVQVRMFDIQGRTVKAFKRHVNGQMELNTADIESGTYFIQILDDFGTIATKRFVKN